jgi:hypothetical protein
MIQGASSDPDENLVLARLGVGNVFVAKNFWTTEFVYTNGFHASFGNFKKLPQVDRPIPILGGAAPDVTDLTKVKPWRALISH